MVDDTHIWGALWRSLPFLRKQHTAGESPSHVHLCYSPKKIHQTEGSWCKIPTGLLTKSTGRELIKFSNSAIFLIFCSSLCIRTDSWMIFMLSVGSENSIKMLSTSSLPSPSAISKGVFLFCSQVASGLTLKNTTVRTEKKSSQDGSGAPHHF